MTRVLLDARLELQATDYNRIAYLANLEAMLLDERRYEEWLELYSEECLYWMPVDPDSSDGLSALNIVYDNRMRLGDRVSRLISGSAHTEDPPARTARVLGAVGVTDVTESQHGPAVRTNIAFHLLMHRRGVTEVFGGKYTHQWEQSDKGDWQIREKRVGLISSDAPLPALTIIF